jgi:hypothetical protein
VIKWYRDRKAFSRVKVVLGDGCVERGRVESDKSRTDISQVAAFYLSVISSDALCGLTQSFHFFLFFQDLLIVLSTLLPLWKISLPSSLSLRVPTYVTLVVMKTQNDFEKQDSVHREATFPQLSLDITLLLRSLEVELHWVSQPYVHNLSALPCPVVMSRQRCRFDRK